MPENDSRFVVADNFRPIPPFTDSIADAAVRFMADVKRGTAIIPMPEEGGIAFRRGAKIFYRALAGDVYEAVIMHVRSPTRVDVDVIVPGCQERVRLSDVAVGGMLG